MHVVVVRATILPRANEGVIMAVDFPDLRFKLENLDVWTVQDKKEQAVTLVDNIDGESLRALSLMAAKRHTVLRPAVGTKTFELLENVIVGLHSADCSDLAKQTISIAPDWILRTFLLASVSRFNSVDQLALREVISAREQEFGSDVELSKDDLAAAQQVAAEAAERAAAIERGDIADPSAVDTSVKGKGRAARAPKAPREKKVKLSAAERAAANRAAKKPVLHKPDPNVKVKRNWLTGKPVS